MRERRSQQVVRRRGPRQPGVVGGVAGDAVADQRPEGVVGQQARAGQDRAEVAQEAVHDVGVDRQRGQVGTHDRADPLDGRGQRPVGDDGDLLADVLHDHPHRDVVAQHHDQVLAVRHEGEVVREQAVHEGPEVGAQVGRDPRVRGEPGGRDQLGDVRHPVGVAVQQRGHRGQPLALREPRHRALAPERGDHLAVRRGDREPVVGVAGPADRRVLAQHREPERAQLLVVVDQGGDPVVDRGRRLHVGRRQPPDEPHVLDRERDLHVGPLGVVDGEERPDRLLGPVRALDLAEVHQRPAGDVGANVIAIRLVHCHGWTGR